jgi:hypothetical protein
MAEISVYDAIGLNLYAKTTIAKLDSSLNKTGSFKAGDYVGKIYSWITRNGKIYWVVEDPTIGNKYYYVLHGKGIFEVTKQIKSIIEKDKLKEQEQLKEEKGNFQYYVDRYLPYVLLTFVAIAVIKKKL